MKAGEPADRTEEPTTPRPPVQRQALPWVITGIVVVAPSLRAPIIAPTAVIGDIQAGTGLSAAGAGLLTGLPVLLFALVTPLATRVIRRFGPETAAGLCLAGILAGTVIRSAGPAAIVLAGTVLIGAAMTLGNIAVPVLIRRDVPWRRISAVTGAYSATMNVGSMATLLGTAPLAARAGWRWAIAALLVLAFCGQSAAYYATTAWLPLLLPQTRGLAPAASGATASLFQVAAIVGAFGVPLLAARS